MIEFLLQMLCEILLQGGIESLFEFALHAMAEPFSKPRNPWVAGIGYSIFGALAGGLSLWLLPFHLVSGETLRRVNFVVTPIAAGLLMSAMGAWRARRGDTVLRIDRFAYGYLFALALAVVRFSFAK